MKISEINQIIDNVVSEEVRRTILKESKENKKEVYHIKCEGIPLATFESEEEANDALPDYKAKHKDGELIIEKGVYESHDDMMDKLDEMNDQLEETDDMQNTENQPMEGNEFSGALKAAREAGEDKFTVDGKEYDVEECWSKQMEEELHGNQDKIDADKDGKISANDFKMLLKKKSDVDETEEECDECGGGMTSVNEGKKVLRLTESEMIKVIKQIVKESIPGLEALNKAKKGTETETNSHMADVEKEMKKQASFDGNDNPEFPKQVELSFFLS